MGNKPLMCVFGIHKWYLDSAVMTEALRCSKCNEWKDVWEGQRVEAERSMWESLNLCGDDHRIDVVLRFMARVDEEVNSKRDAFNERWSS